MTPDQLKLAGKELYGTGWQTKMAKELGVDGSTVRRWISGSVPVPNPAAAAVQCFLARRRETYALAQPSQPSKGSKL